MVEQPIDSEWTNTQKNKQSKILRTAAVIFIYPTYLAHNIRRHNRRITDTQVHKCSDSVPMTHATQGH